jgi:hypothetical protein
VLLLGVLHEAQVESQMLYSTRMMLLCNLCLFFFSLSESTFHLNTTSDRIWSVHRLSRPSSVARPAPSLSVAQVAHPPPSAHRPSRAPVVYCPGHAPANERRCPSSQVACLPASARRRLSPASSTRSPEQVRHQRVWSRPDASPAHQ